MTTSHHRGHIIYWDGQEWRYLTDNLSIKNNERPCIRCGKYPSPEGHDACLGYIPNVRNACCGHGVRAGYIQYKNGRCIQLPKRG